MTMKRSWHLVLPVALALAASCKRVDETRFLGFDAESTTGHLGPGWSGFEATPEGDSFSWCQATRAKVALQDRGDGDRLIRLRCWPFRYPGGPAQTMTVFVNGAKIDSVALGDGPRVYAMPSPKAVWLAGTNEIAFEFTYAEAPKDKVPGSTDDRKLAGAFDWLEIQPMPVKKS